jgi:glycosyltransferase involved in cell wall biosynthesis
VHRAVWGRTPECDRAEEVKDSMVQHVSEKREGGLRTEARFREGSSGSPLVTVITVVRNAEGYIERTINSVVNQTYRNKEYLIVDGHSTDRTLDILRTYDQHLDYWMSEPDRGVYDAMNKGIDLATGTWLIFINAGDVFFDEHALEKTVEQVSDGVELLYSDTWFHGTCSRLVHCDHRKMRIIHQSLLYRKSLHKEAGKYLVSRGVTISDYIFFNLLTDRHWKKVGHVIARCDDRGISAHSRTLYQKLAVDLIFQTEGRLSVALLLLFYPFYKILKTLYWRVVKE